jgi:hypothetical protein
MDFRRPGEHPVEDMSRHYDGTDGVMPPFHPFQQTIVKPKGNKGLKSLAWALTVLFVAAAAYGAYSYLDQQSLRTQLNDSQRQVAILTKDKAILEAQQDKTAKAAETALTDEDRVKLAAGAYVCNIDKFGCDKLSETILRLQKFVAPGPGWAIVKATNTSTNATTNLYLRTVDNLNWVVVYEGATPPSSDVAKHYAIPADFLRLP